MKSIVVDKRISEEMSQELVRLGLSPIYLESYSALGKAVASHPDTLLFKYKDRLFFDKGYEREHPEVLRRIREAAPTLRLIPTPDALGAVYPEDTRYNALLTENGLFLREKSASGAILALKDEGVEITPVKQGYPACTTLTFKKSALTADRGMAAALLKSGISVTLIREGFISLPPHEYGFIGGASFVLEGFVYFFGDYRLHPDSVIIENAIKSEGLIPISLGTSPLVDLGGAIVIE